MHDIKLRSLLNSMKIYLFVTKMPYEYKYQYAMRPTPGYQTVYSTQGSVMYPTTRYQYNYGYDYVWVPSKPISFTADELKIIYDAVMALTTEIRSCWIKLKTRTTNFCRWMFGYQIVETVITIASEAPNETAETL